MLTPFTRRVLAAVRSIPPGRVATYGDIARMAGRPRAARAVGNIMRGCSSPDVPCHRVIAAGGRLGGYGGNVGLKRNLLQAEGVVVAGTRVRGAEDLRWPGGERSKNETDHLARKPNGNRRRVPVVSSRRYRSLRCAH